MTFGAARSMVTTGASVEKQMLVAPESTMSVVFGVSARCCRVWLDSTLLMCGKVKAAMSKVGLKLAV